MSDPRPLPVLSAAPVTLRHIRQGAGGTAVLGALYVPQAAAGVNGTRGYQNGTYEPALSEDGTGKVTLPNAAGEDGVLHRRRFQCFTDPDYFPGDEWVEVWQDNRVLFVGTPIGWGKTRSTLTLELADGAGLLPTQREFGAGFWWHAPRDVFENYTRAWRICVADDFVGGYDGARWAATIGTGGAITAQASAVRMTVPTTAGQSVTLDTFAGYWPGINLITSRAWRAECRFSQSLVGSAGAAFTIVGGGGNAATIQTDAVTGNVLAYLSVPLGTSVTVAAAISKTALDVTLAIERHDRWVLFYAQGALVYAAEADWTVATNAQPRFSLLNTAGAGVSGTVDLDYIVVRDLQPYLMRNSALDPGDYRLPATPPAGGLRGSYYDDAPIGPLGDTSGDYYVRVLPPTKQPYARRQDATINFTSASPPAWQAPGAGATNFSVRWTGAIWLDLVAADVTLRLTSLDNGARLYVGKTVYGQHLLQQWGNPTGAPYTLTSGSLRTHLGTVSGWYPVRLEYVQGAASGGIILQQSIGGAAYAVVPATSLSPYGIYEAAVRYDSFAEQIRALVDTFGLQYRVEPRSLESGFFPGEMTPRVRVGRDTEKILEPPEATDVAVTGSASDSAMTLLADAAGLADPSNAAQVSAEAVDFAAVWPPAAADRHIAVATGYESLADITDPGLLYTRLAAMLALRNTPWEEIGAKPRGHRQILDSFPLTGAAAAFDWEPGDAVRLADDQLDLADTTPRQIIAPAWSFVPDGRGAPTVRFRQRPRAQQDALRAVVRAALIPHRNYQGQLIAVDGTWMHLDGQQSRVALPPDISDVVSAEFVMTDKSDTSAWTIQDAGTAATLVTISFPGHYDITPYVRRFVAGSGGGSQQFVVGYGPSGTGTGTGQLRFTIRI